MSKIAVLTNDLQYELVHKNPARSAAVESAASNFIAFLDGIRRRGHHVFHLQLIIPPDDPNEERDEHGRLPVQEGTEGAEIVREFVDDPDVVVVKNKDSGFYETDLHEQLQALGVDTVVITGMQTQICVQTTAADAFFRGYKVWVPADCVVSARPEDKERALEWLAGYCATVSDSAEILRLIDELGELPRKTVKIP